MSSKARSKETNAFPQGKKNQDLLQRLNHLYQANTYLTSVSDQLATTVSPASPVGFHSNDGSLSGEKARKARGKNACEKEDVLGVVARRSNQRFKVMVKHNILHTDPSLKRSFCKGCNTICIPGFNARVRVKSSKVHGNKLITTCSTCLTTRTIPVPPTQPAPSSSNTSLSQNNERDSTLPGQAEERPSADVIDRITKRRKVARKMPFWRKEAPTPLSANGFLSRSGHPAMKVDDFPGVDPEPDAALVAAKSAHSAMERLSPNVTSSSGATAIPSRGPAVTSQPGVVTQSDLSATTTQGNEAPTSTPSVATLSSNNAGGPKQKQPKAQKQKGKNAGNGDSHGVKQDGHHVWRGEELVTGWGDLTQPRHTTPSM